MEQVVNIEYEICEAVMQSILAIAEILIETTLEISVTSIESINKLTSVISSIPSEFNIFDEQYEKKVKRYRINIRNHLKGFSKGIRF